MDGEWVFFFLTEEGVYDICVCLVRWEVCMRDRTCFFTIQVEIGEVWGCPGGAHGPYEDIPSNFGRIWSYMASESPLFNI